MYDAFNKCMYMTDEQGLSTKDILSMVSYSR